MIILKSKDDEISHLVATPLLTIQKKLPLFIQSRTTFFCCSFFRLFSCREGTR